jgi:hypothetical protein
MTENEIPECYRWANDLNVGDVVFVSSYNNLSKSKVTKLTATQIVVGNHNVRFRRHTLSNKADSWLSNVLLKNTPELEAQHQRNLLIHKIFELIRHICNINVMRVTVEKLTYEQLIELQKKLQDVVWFCNECRPIKAPTGV